MRYHANKKSSIARQFRTLRIEGLESRQMLSVTQPIELTNVQSDYMYNSYAESGVMKYNSTVDDLIGLTEVQEKYGLSGSGQTVVIIDSGITTDHNAFRSGQIVGGWDFAENDADPSDDSFYGGHGTHLAGILAGSTTKYTGVAPGVDLVVLRVFDDNGVGSFELIEDALQWVQTNLNTFENPITAINLSVGSVSSNSDSSDWSILDDELESLYDSGVFISVAAGNDYKDYPNAGVAYPACSQYTVSVGAVDGDGDIAYYSQRDTNTIFAPGYGIYSSIPDILGNNNNRSDDYTRMTGTSMATPIITGVSCLLREAYADMGYTSVDQSDIYSVMTSTADKVYDSATGQYYNRINILKAVEYIYGLEATDNDVETKEDDVTVTQTDTHSTDNSHDVIQTDTHTTDKSQNVTQTDTHTTDKSQNVTQTDTHSTDKSQNVTNLPDGVTISNSKLLFTGTSKADTLKVDASGNQWKFTYNGVTLTYSFDTINSVQYNAGSGTDLFEFITGTGTDSIRCYQDYTLINGNDYVVKAFGTEQTTIKADSSDSVTFYDSTGTDNFSLNIESKVASWTSGLTSWTASGMKEVNVTQSNGGTNSATIYDSTVADLFSVTENMFSYNSSDFRAYIVGLTDVNLKSVNGGMDTVRYTSSQSVTSLTTQAGNSTFKTDLILYSASGFYYTYAYAGTGNCSAILKDSTDTSKADYIIASVNQTKMYSSNYQTVVSGFNNVKVISSDSSNTDSDVATIYGSEVTEDVIASGTATSISDGQHTVTISNFATRRIGKLSDSDSVTINDVALEEYLTDNMERKYKSSKYTLWFN